MHSAWCPMHPTSIAALYLALLNSALASIRMPCTAALGGVEACSGLCGG
jgi:hypothetical protein